jgi:hypothetical protein
VRRHVLLRVRAAPGATVAGCGDEPAPTPREPVRLAITAPRDAATTSEATVVVSGSVAPAGARVIVVGRRVAVGDGRFSTTVELREGTNVIDVGGSAPLRRATWRAVRVTRRSTIGIPELVGRDEDDAKAALSDLGLAVEVTNDDDLLDVFRRGPRIVCRTSPDAGVRVHPGAPVEIVVSKTC